MQERLQELSRWLSANPPCDSDATRFVADAADWEFSEGDFLCLCETQKVWHIERTTSRVIEMRPISGWEHGVQCGEAGRQLAD